MPAYQPGQGLSREALQRLKARARAEGGHPHLPATDESQQWEKLLGGDAKKKTRCGVCTRPLSVEEQAAESLICSRCSEVEIKSQDAKCKEAPACQTPSTDAASDLAAEEAAVAAPPCGELLSLAAARKRLEGEWLCEDGSTFQVFFHGGLVGSCSSGSGSSKRSYTLECDGEEQVVWWGVKKAYYAKVSELLQGADEITWHPHRAKDGGKPFVWRQPQPVVKPTVLPWPSSAEAKAQAIAEIVEQLSQPGSDGRVRVPRWNQRYRTALGNMRSFLESCPDRFILHIQENKEYTVSLVQQASGDEVEEEKEEEEQETEEQGTEDAAPAAQQQPRQKWRPKFAPQVPRAAAPTAASQQQQPQQPQGPVQEAQQEPAQPQPVQQQPAAWSPSLAPQRVAPVRRVGEQPAFVSTQEAPVPSMPVPVAPGLPPPPVPAPTTPPRRRLAAGMAPVPKPRILWALPNPALQDLERASLALEAAARKAPCAQLAIEATKPAPGLEMVRTLSNASTADMSRMPSNASTTPPIYSSVSSSDDDDVEEQDVTSAPSNGAQQEQEQEEEPMPLPPATLEEALERQQLADEVVRRVEDQLFFPKSGGFVWIEKWQKRYLRHLGPLRSFLESRPDKFRVVRLNGKAYRVELSSDHGRRLSL